MKEMKGVAPIVIGLLIVVAIVVAVGAWYVTRPPAEKVTLKLIYWPGPESESLTPVLEWYNSERAPETGFEVEMVCFSREEFWTKEDTFLVAGSSEFDILTAGCYNVAHYAPHMSDIEDLREDLEDMGCLKVHLDGLTVDGKLYCIPTLGLNNHVFFYREDLIDDLLTDSAQQEKFRTLSKTYLGEEMTPKHPDDWTLDDWVATSLFFTKKYNLDSPTVYGTGTYGKRGMMDAPWPLMDIAWLYGGRWFKPGTNEPDFTSDAWVKAMELYDNLRKMEIFPAEIYNWEYMAVDGGLKAGTIAFSTHFSIAWAGLNDPEQTEYAGKFGMTYLPGLRQTDGTIKRCVYVNPVGLGISKYSEHKEEAKSFLLEMMSPEWERKYVEQGGIPVTSPILSEVGEERPDLAIDLDMMAKYGFSLPVVPQSIDILVCMSTHISAVLAGTETPEEALSGINTEVEEIMGA